MVLPSATLSISIAVLRSRDRSTRPPTKQSTSLSALASWPRWPRPDPLTTHTKSRPNQPLRRPGQTESARRFPNGIEQIRRGIETLTDLPLSCDSSSHFAPAPSIRAHRPSPGKVNFFFIAESTLARKMIFGRSRHRPCRPRRLLAVRTFRPKGLNRASPGERKRGQGNLTLPCPLSFVDITCRRQASLSGVFSRTAWPPAPCDRPARESRHPRARGCRDAPRRSGR